MRSAFALTILIAEIEARWESRAEWRRDYEQFGDEDSGEIGWENGSAFFYPVPTDRLDGTPHRILGDYVPDHLVGDAVDEARKDIATLIALLRNRTTLPETAG